MSPRGEMSKDVPDGRPNGVTGDMPGQRHGDMRADMQGETPHGRPTLLLLTANYPFLRDGGETSFLAPEVEVLAAQGAFDLRVVPLRTAPQSLPLPAGVQVDPTLALGFAATRLQDLLWAWRWPGFGAELRRALRHGGAVGVLRVWRWAAVARATQRWLAAQQQPGTVLGYSYWRGGASMALAAWARQHSARVALTRVHRYELYEDGFSPPFQPWVSVYGELDATVTVSSHGLDYLRSRAAAPARLHLARLGTTAAARRSASSADGVLRVVSCSFLRPVKRVPLLAQALVHLATAHPTRRIDWTHLGDGPERSAVQAALAGAPANLQVQLAGPMANAAVRAWYAEHEVDLFVQVSQSEGLPVAVMEALAAGVPVIATDVGGVDEAVDAQVGLLLPADPGAAEVADAIAALGLLNTAAERAALRDAAFARWAERFDAARNHAQFGRWLLALTTPYALQAPSTPAGATAGTSIGTPTSTPAA